MRAFFIVFAFRFYRVCVPLYRVCVPLYRVCVPPPPWKPAWIGALRGADRPLSSFYLSSTKEGLWKSLRLASRTIMNSPPGGANQNPPALPRRAEALPGRGVPPQTPVGMLPPALSRAAPPCRCLQGLKKAGNRGPSGPFAPLALDSSPSEAPVALWRPSWSLRAAQPIGRPVRGPRRASRSGHRKRGPLKDGAVNNHQQPPSGGEPEPPSATAPPCGLPGRGLRPQTPVVPAAPPLVVFQSEGLAQAPKRAVEDLQPQNWYPRAWMEPPNSARGSIHLGWPLAAWRQSRPNWLEG